MGRHYNGDIEGKFWFGVQSSNDADYFGVKGYARDLEYYFDRDDIPKIEKGIKSCKHELSELIQGGADVLDRFFSKTDMYQDKDIAELIEKANKWDVKGPKACRASKKTVEYTLKWYARLRLGKEILDCVIKHNHCHFNAEI
tara:strand:- start:392 stop:817 length:426 start_codon:yes stop_codon:yes gene_type:complete